MIKLLPKYDNLILTMPRLHRALDPKKLEVKDAVIKKSSKHALNYAQKIASENDLILVTGSIYLVSEIRRLLFS
ncbi:hypothetical protein GOV08_03260 [Candidatus Woesearchaeota archaeon]|nr:hypothetical protein [Candidatus Woesearchaeota archaeon]